MKNIKKALIGGLVTIVGFYIVCMCMTGVAGFVFIGDPFTISFHLYTYVGITLLASIIVFCTILLMGKLNEIEKKITKENNIEI